MDMLRMLLLLSLVAITSACGFAPRKPVDLAPVLKSVHVQAPDPGTPLVLGLERELTAAGAQVVAVGSSSAVVKIVSETFERNVISLDERAKVGEFQISYELRYEVLDADGSSLLGTTPITLSRVYSFDEQQALGAAQEEELIRTELQRDAVRLVMERIGRVRGGSASAAPAR